jgi:hypothetical protein
MEYPFRLGSAFPVTFEALLDFTVINLLAKVIVLVAVAEL